MCSFCGFDSLSNGNQTYPLPRLTKKVIYLDQSALSEMLKVLNPECARGAKDRSVWEELYRKLYRLTRLQLALCPLSPTHRRESAIWEHGQKLVRLARRLGLGAEWQPRFVLVSQQLGEHAKAWAQGKTCDWSFLTPHHALAEGSVGSWSDPVLWVPHRPEASDWTAQAKVERIATACRLRDVFGLWKANEPLSMDEYVQAEVDAFRERCLQQVGKYLRSPELIMTESSAASLLVGMVHEGLRQAGVPSSECWSRCVEYLRTAKIEEVPSVGTFARLAACLAIKATGGQKKLPDDGMADDLEFVSAYLPYVDMITTDDYMSSLLADSHAVDALPRHSLICSTRDMPILMAYLDKLEQSADDKHMSVVGDLYGQDALQPDMRPVPDDDH